MSFGDKVEDDIVEGLGNKAKDSIEEEIELVSKPKTQSKSAVHTYQMSCPSRATPATPILKQLNEAALQASSYKCNKLFDAGAMLGSIAQVFTPEAETACTKEKGVFVSISAESM
jgi:hypothetical protein